MGSDFLNINMLGHAVIVVFSQYAMPNTSFFRNLKKYQIHSLLLNIGTSYALTSTYMLRTNKLRGMNPI